MLSKENRDKVKEVTKKLGSTQASVVNALVGYALVNIEDALPLIQDEVELAQKRGRKPGSKVVKTKVTVVEETFEDELGENEGLENLEKVLNAPFEVSA
jgi:predicted DNA-binding protein